MNNLIKNILLVIFSTVIGILFAELFARLLINGPDQKPSTGDPYKLYEFDNKLGWKNKSNYQGVFERDEFKFEVNFNSEGMREKEVFIKKPKNKKRIAVMGDSFTWGVGVKDSERFTNIVENKNNDRFEVLNFGVSGYGPIQYLLQLDKILEFNPDIIFIAFCLGNDFADNVFYNRYGYYKPFTVLNDSSEIDVHGYPLPRVHEFNTNYQFVEHPFLKSILKNSQLNSLIHSFLLKKGYIVQKFPNQAGHIGTDEHQRDIYIPNFSEQSTMYMKDMSDVNKKILAKIRDRLKTKNIKLSIIVTPTKCEYGSCFRPFDYKKNNNARNLLIEDLKELKINYIDNTDSLNLVDFWEDDGHWRPSGHIKIADGILKWLLNE